MVQSDLNLESLHNLLKTKLTWRKISPSANTFALDRETMGLMSRMGGNTSVTQNTIWINSILSVVGFFASDLVVKMEMEYVDPIGLPL